MKILGSVFIVTGILILSIGSLAGFGIWIWSLILDQQYPTAVIASSTGLIALGYTIKWIFNKKNS